MQNCYTELPSGYRALLHIDAKNKKTAILLTLASVPVIAAVLIPALITADYASIAFDRFLFYDLGLLGGLLLYIVLHELVHGAAYKLLTKQKLTFGLSWSCAFCGVPNCYVSRRTALISVSAPLLLFSLLLAPTAFALRTVDTGAFLTLWLLFSIHLGGCVGDAYVMLLLLFRFRDPSVLMRDTGPEQWFYCPGNAEERKE